ncbi:MAG TPA: nuclear transport factor 2 family protein [Rariglobus sp.]|jgi:hypothetical protein|nr:nuclear transport factor 2 family protein [Rariglobus sp.]
MRTRNHSITLPEAVAAYWTAANAGANEAALACFSPDAVVHDEGKDLRGPDAIRTWIDETTRKYHPLVEPLRIEEKDGRHLVTARVSGDFPGSPVELDYAFTLKHQKITRLEIS